jgi:Ca2+-binding EF-hand superfamily protein
MVGSAKGSQERREAVIIEDLNPVAARSAHELFRRTDVNGDGLISFDEYCLMFTFVSTGDRLFKTAFYMFDRNRKGKIDFDEFKSVIRAVSADPTATYSLEDSAIVKSMFGDRLDQQLSFPAFLEKVQQMRWDFLALEFYQYDRAQKGHLSLNSVRRLLWHSQAIEEASGEQIMVPWRVYQGLFDVVRESEEISRALEILCDGKAKRNNSSRGVNQVEFARALKCTSIDLSQGDVDLIFRAFDLDNSGALEVDEFRKVCELRQAFFARYVPSFDKPQRNPIQQFVYCMQQRQ